MILTGGFVLCSKLRQSSSPFKRGLQSRILMARSSGTLLGQEILTVANLHTKLQAHIAGLGVGYMPTHLIKKEIAVGKLIVKKVQKPKTATHFTVAWRLKQAGNATGWWLAKLKNFKI